MSTWSDGYFTETSYTYGYYREISPHFMRFCLLLSGIEAPQPSADSCHCELGFGQGVSLNIHAASNAGSFVGTDFSAGQTAFANSLAAASGAPITLYDDSFEELLQRHTLPQFDSIALHGIWTWITPENRTAIIDFARKHLKPGGMFYVSYNCHPGWTPAAPLRQVMALHERFMVKPDSALSRVEQALDFTDKLLDANPVYGLAVPKLKERMQNIRKHDRNYIAHEYFNREWNCLYFTDVVDQLEAAKLEFAGSANPMDCVDSVNLSQDAQEFLKGVGNPLFRQQLRDYFVNAQFRKDIFVRGVRRLTTAEQAERLANTRVVLLCPVDSVSLTIPGPCGEVTLHENVYKPLLEALADKKQSPKTLSELAAALPDLGLPAIVSAITILVGTGRVSPCQDEKPFLKTCKALNLHFMDQAVHRGEVNYFASPVLGGAINVHRVQQLFCLAMHKGHKKPEDWAAFVWDILQSQGQKVMKAGKNLETQEENMRELTEQANAFAQKGLQILKAVQVI